MVWTGIFGAMPMMANGWALVGVSLVRVVADVVAGEVDDDTGCSHVGDVGHGIETWEALGSRSESALPG